MDQDEPDTEQHLGKTEARAGATPHMTRHILPISLILLVVLFAVILFVAR